MLVATLTLEGVAQQPGVIKNESILKTMPSAAYASTIVEIKTIRSSRLVPLAAESGRLMWESGCRVTKDRWSDRAPFWRALARMGSDAIPAGTRGRISAEVRPLVLFYKVGPSPERWWSLITTSDNQGVTWSEPKLLPKDHYGPIRSKPVELPEGVLLCGSSTEEAGWRVHMEWLRSPGKDYGKTEPLNESREVAAIQPTILVHRLDRIQILCRTKQGRIVDAWSNDRGKHWSPLTRTELPNPNSAIDAVKLEDGRSLLVYNHSRDDRGVLNVAVSSDGHTWDAAAVLEDKPGDEYSYPAVIQTRDGLVHITYSWKRERIKHAVIDPAQLRPKPIIEGTWPALGTR